MLILFVLRNLTFCNVCKTIVLIVLRDVKTDMLALLANAHWDEVVDEPVTEVAHNECIDDYYNEGVLALFWSSSENISFSAYYMGLDFNHDDAGLNYDSKNIAFPVRCLQD